MVIKKEKEKKDGKESEEKRECFCQKMRMSPAVSGRKCILCERRLSRAARAGWVGLDLAAVAA